jgi:hypothetical protein
MWRRGLMASSPPTENGARPSPGNTYGGSLYYIEKIEEQHIIYALF